jgi:hypothetical protein
MCDSSSVRNWLIGLGALTGWAISSAWFAYAWRGYPIVALISTAITFIACVAAFVALGVTLNMLSTFCSCASGSSLCKEPCDMLQGLIFATIAPLVALIAPTAQGIIAETSLVILYLATAAFASLTAGIAIYYSRLATCQAPPPG